MNGARHAPRHALMLPERRPLPGWWRRMGTAGAATAHDVLIIFSQSRSARVANAGFRN